MTDLIDGYDAAFFDLDGVIYLGPQAVDGAVAGVQVLRERGVRVMYVTNNAAREAQVVIDQLNDLGFAADDDNVLTSAQVAATALGRTLPAGARVLVAGTQNLVNLIAAAGFTVVTSATQQPAAVIQGYNPDLNWRVLDEVALAIQGGARWYATNDDASRPTDRGLVPGIGGALAVVRMVVGGEPTTFGKPFRPMLDEAIRRTGASGPIFVGDRIDTDIVGAVNAGIDSLMVFTGAHGKADLIDTRPNERPTHIGADVGALLEPAREVEFTDSGTRCRSQEASVAGGTIVLGSVPGDLTGQLDALWAVAQLAWQHGDLDAGNALASLELVH